MRGILEALVYDAYFNDDWRITPDFSLNAGVRWEYGAPITELYNRLVNLDIGPGFSAAAPVLASDPIGPLTGQYYPTRCSVPTKLALSHEWALRGVRLLPRWV
ncbi:MAG TPA: hypothetical protein VF283_17285 [Bryobacteraceae bacterium]